MKTIVFILSICIIFPLTVLSQKKTIKYGNIDIEDLRMTVYSPEPDAPAVILGDIGYTEFIYTEDFGFQVMYTRHLRIKILKEEGISYANLNIKLKNPKGTYKEFLADERDLSYRWKLRKTRFKEEIAQLKGNTYNLENGEIKKIKLKSKYNMQEYANKPYDIVELTMPNAKIGSIIDIQYTTCSDFVFSLREFDVEREIPIVYYENILRIPYMYNYKQTISSNIEFEYETNTVWKEYSFKVSPEFNANLLGGKLVRGGLYSFRIEDNYFTYIANNIPSFKNNDNENKQTPMIYFELESLLPKFGKKELYSDKWESVGKQLLEDDKFGDILSKSNNFLNDYVTSIEATTEDKSERLKLAYTTIQENIEWNQYYDILAKDNLSKVYKKGAGNSAEVNFMLIALLRKLKFNTQPLLISTKDNGPINTNEITIAKFNHVLACVIFDDKKILLDAIDPSVPYDSLPENSCNGYGKLLTNDFSDWVELIR